MEENYQLEKRKVELDEKRKYTLQKAVKEVDEGAFLIMMESNEVRGEGFKPH